MMTRLYILSGPDGVVRYVGKTSQSLADRLKTHFAQARSRRTNYRSSNWIRSVNYQVTIDLVAEVQGTGAKEEIELIAALRALGLPLTNITAGGEGALGRKLSPASVEKIRAALTGRKGTPRSPETRAKMSAALKGRRPAPHVMAALRAANVGKKHGPTSPEVRRRISEARSKIPQSVVEAARGLIASGWTQQRAADHLNISQSQLSERLRKEFR